jgi:hypothetical protein
LSYEAYLSALVQFNALVGGGVIEMTLAEYGVASFKHEVSLVLKEK